MDLALPGWYGKVASRGDFVQRRLPSEWVGACDAWLSTTLSGAQAALGPRWLDIYLTAPILRFAWSPGLMDDAWWLGVLMPSCDNVGRYFPLIVAASRDRPPVDGAALDHLATWYRAISDIALATLDEGRTSLDDIDDAIRRLPLWPADRGQSPDGAAPATVGPFPLPTSDDASLLPWARAGGRSFWWTGNEHAVTRRIAVVDGLPDAACFADLLVNRQPDEHVVP